MGELSPPLGPTDTGSGVGGWPQCVFASGDVAREGLKFHLGISRPFRALRAHKRPRVHIPKGISIIPNGFASGDVDSHGGREELSPRRANRCRERGGNYQMRAGPGAFASGDVAREGLKFHLGWAFLVPFGTPRAPSRTRRNIPRGK